MLPSWSPESSFTGKSSLGVKDNNRKMGQDLLGADQYVPNDTLFRHSNANSVWLIYERLVPFEFTIYVSCSRSCPS